MNIIFDEELDCKFIHKPFDLKNENDLKELSKKYKIIKGIQTHSTNVKVITKDNINEVFENVDGLITNLKNIYLLTVVADCQGILLFDKKNKVIGNIHSGWRGTLNRIIKNAVNIMINEFNSNVEDIKVYFSPCIHKCCFEVSIDVKEMFEKEFNDLEIENYITKGNREDKYYIDTLKLNIDYLIKLGIKEENITYSDFCTKCNSDILHSYRKDKDLSGRNGLLISIK